MCTLSFQPTPTGFYLVMNRDEQLTRTPALPPKLLQTVGPTTLYPYEPQGGTWIGLNEVGLFFALLNWYEKTGPDQRQGKKSRGVIIPELLACATQAEAEKRLASWQLTEFPPFRLIGIGAASQSLREWNWDGQVRQALDYPWRRHHWFSSGYDEPEAVRLRTEVTSKAAEKKGGDSLLWLQELHGSHEPMRGPFSICMHRDDAQTVSCTAISLVGDEASLRYQDGPPCEGRGWVSQKLDLTLVHL